MNYQHKNLAEGRWNSLSFLDQMANVGSEVERSLKWKEKGNMEYSQLAFDRSLELLDLTIGDDKNRLRLKEILRLREFLADYFVFDNTYNSVENNFKDYFYSFTFAARNKI